MRKSILALLACVSVSAFGMEQIERDLEAHINQRLGALATLCDTRGCVLHSEYLGLQLRPGAAATILQGIDSISTAIASVREAQQRGAQVLADLARMGDSVAGPALTSRDQHQPTPIAGHTVGYRNKDIQEWAKGEEARRQAAGIFHTLEITPEFYSTIRFPFYIKDNQLQVDMYLVPVARLGRKQAERLNMYEEAITEGQSSRDLADYIEAWIMLEKAEAQELQGINAAMQARYDANN